MGLFFNRSSKGEKLLRKGRSLCNLVNRDPKYKNDPQLAQEALDYFRQAIEAGTYEALLDMARMYDQGSGVMKDPKLALEYRLQAYSKGVKYAAVLLGRHYFEGNGTQVDYSKAFSYYKEGLAQEEEISSAYIPLAECYLHGWGCAKNIGEAKRIADLLKNSPSYTYVPGKIERLFAHIALVEGADIRTVSAHYEKAKADKCYDEVLERAINGQHPKTTRTAAASRAAAAGRTTQWPAATAGSVYTPEPKATAFVPEDVRKGRAYLQHGDFISAMLCLHQPAKTNPAFRADYDQAEAGLHACYYDDRKSAEENLAKFSPYLEKGGKLISTTMAELYLSGKLGERNLDKALQYALQAVIADRQHIGEIRYPTYGSTPEARLALKHARKVEMQGLDFKQASKLYEPLARAGSTEAMRRLGRVNFYLTASYSSPETQWVDKAKQAGDPVSHEDPVTLAALAAEGDAECADKLGLIYRNKENKTGSSCDSRLGTFFSAAAEQLWERMAEAGCPEAMYNLFIKMEDRYGDVDSPRSQQGMRWGRKALQLGYAPMVFDVAAETDPQVFGCSREQRRRYAIQAKAAGMEAAKYITGLMRLEDPSRREFEAMKESYLRQQDTSAAGELYKQLYPEVEESWPDYVYDSNTREIFDVIPPIFKGNCYMVRRNGSDIPLYRSGSYPSNWYTDSQGNTYYT